MYPNGHYLHKINFAKKFVHTFVPCVLTFGLIYGHKLEYTQSKSMHKLICAINFVQIMAVWITWLRHPVHFTMFCSKSFVQSSLCIILCHVYSSLWQFISSSWHKNEYTQHKSMCKLLWQIDFVQIMASGYLAIQLITGWVSIWPLFAQNHLDKVVFTYFCVVCIKFYASLC